MSQKCHERPHALPDLQVRALLAWRAMSRDRAGQILTPDCKDCPLSCSPEPIGHGQGTVWRRDEHVDERGNANNQKAEQKCSNKSSGSPLARCPTLKNWKIALSCHLSFVGLEAPRGLSLAPCVGLDNYLLAYWGGSLGLGCCFFLHPAAPRQFASGLD